ncbi:twinkle protein [Enhydrobacter aerosaccus]|uniref:Twinkle protein n=1 Tax=Enhydrobacter aerosaccus TaxID=225324 RepID=A0A1T4RNZ4_9HYPH|nr:toprim domain-containing protein [Enhydrobacter aerosaccus]SKA17597.1 twinkle protein [Enhydrobacter aerosaccus]
MTDSEQTAKLDCPDCGGKRSLGVYSDGHTYCFKCGTVTKDSEIAQNVPPDHRTEPQAAIPLENIEYVPLTKRKLSAETTRKWKYGVNGAAQVANYFADDGVTLIDQKVRLPDKTMFWKVGGQEVGLYGKWLWPKGGKRVIVTEGEIDALTVSQLQDNKWPVVSLPHGAQTAVKAIKKDMDWLLSFETVVLAFDMDEPGQAAAKKCAEVLPLGKVRIAKLPAKDANEAWTTGKVEALSSSLWNAEAFKLDGIVAAADIAATIMDEPKMGTPWKWDSLTKLTYGRRPGEIIGFGGGTGGGKTDFFSEQIEFDVCTLKVPTGILFLEQPPEVSIRRIMGKHLSKMLHIPGKASKEDLATASRLAKDLPLYFFDHFGQMDWETIKARIIYMVKSLGCKHIYLDHLTALSADAEDENKELGRIMAQIAGLAQEMGFIFHYISHLATPEGKPHEEGGRISFRHFRGSRAIQFWSHTGFGLERNQQAEDQDTKLTTTLRCLKCREYGLATGEVLFFKYDPETGRQNETDKAPAPSAEGFQRHAAPNDY